ncbi:hypothetical protein [Xanthobacter autotrophicus]|uniref:hypothetical protein n=1 Tax=Xanthobacter autotrophicus TaxID=280 RepID=UPI00372ACF8A
MPKRSISRKVVQAPVHTFEHQPELRALPVLAAVPGHLTFPVPDEAFHPHLRRGEFAEVDLADHQPAHGELFLIAYRDPRAESGRRYRLCEMRRKRSRCDGTQEGWIAHHHEPEAGPFWLAHSAMALPLSEGIFSTSGAADRLVGRIVGVFVPPIGSTRGPAREA